ncbi:exodeoxyribonuclease VII small subunit [Lipingzhangella sp. LS1_29]|uniref:Exodeoxyribonuclease 7 small subunit n=1 Tax=Lipingzhangella rawalii TaxID=2055835 RepID=A0ABU2H9X3_9ACTN|nr:exodeoxyribonuclease VII small subunit [Lipingzhangella rawalii]MDS1272129.1 exodeoxyribonuclease VII small subunit [Lipingzhangella rawalii]
MSDDVQPDTAGADTDTPPEGETSLSYEQARDELTAVVRQLEAGGLTLAESLELWERGERLATTCEQWLEGARAKLAVAMAADTENEENTDEAAAGRGDSGKRTSADTPF